MNSEANLKVSVTKFSLAQLYIACFY